VKEDTRGQSETEREREREREREVKGREADMPEGEAFRRTQDRRGYYGYARLADAL
jgi:hypothetical protein